VKVSHVTTNFVDGARDFAAKHNRQPQPKHLTQSVPDFPVNRIDGNCAITHENLV
jgi:hypothetical protein